MTNISSNAEHRDRSLMYTGESLRMLVLDEWVMMYEFEPRMDDRLGGPRFLLPLMIETLITPLPQALPLNMQGIEIIKEDEAWRTANNDFDQWDLWTVSRAEQAALYQTDEEGVFRAQRNISNDGMTKWVMTYQRTDPNTSPPHSLSLYQDEKQDLNEDNYMDTSQMEEDAQSQLSQRTYGTNT